MDRVVVTLVNGDREDFWSPDTLECYYEAPTGGLLVRMSRGSELYRQHVFWQGEWRGFEIHRNVTRPPIADPS